MNYNRRVSYILARADINIYRKAYPNGIWGPGDIFFQDIKPTSIDTELGIIISSRPDLSVFGNTGLGNAVGSEKCSDLWSMNFLRCLGMVLVEIFLGKQGGKISPAWPDVTPEFIEGVMSSEERRIPPKVAKVVSRCLRFFDDLDEESHKDPNDRILQFTL